MCSREGASERNDDATTRENETIYIDGISIHLRDRIEVQEAVLLLVEEIGKNYTDEVDEIKILDKGGVRVVFTGTETAEAMVKLRKTKLPGKNNRSGRPLEDNIRIKWPWNKMAREAARNNSLNNSIYIYVNPKDFMTNGVDGWTGDEVEIQEALLQYLDLPTGATCQLFKKPACFYVYLKTSEERDQLVNNKVIRTKRTVKARCVYKVGKRQQQHQQRYDSTLPAWTNVSSSFTTVEPTSSQTTNTTSDEPRGLNSDESDIDLDSVTNTSNSLTMSDDRIRKTVEETIEVSLHKFMAEQQKQQAQQITLRNNESNQHAQRLDAIERLILSMAERQTTSPQIENGSKGDNPIEQALTPSKSLDMRRLALGQVEESEQIEPAQGDQKSKKQKMSKGVSNVLPTTPTQVVGSANTEASGGTLRQVIKPIVQSTLKVNRKPTDVKTRSMRQQTTQEPPPMADEVSSIQTTSNSAP
jgi:hypothetical protein